MFDNNLAGFTLVKEFEGFLDFVQAKAVCDNLAEIIPVLSEQRQVIGKLAIGKVIARLASLNYIAVTTSFLDLNPQ